MTSDPPRPRGCLARGGGVYLVCAAVLVGLLAWLALFLLSEIAAKPPYPPSEIPAVVLRFVQNPMLAPLLALPALLIGVLLLVRRPRRATGALAGVLIGTALLLVPFVIALYCFVALIAPMYEYRDI